MFVDFISADLVVLGGTHIVGSDDPVPEESDTKRILKGCTKVEPSLKVG